MEAFVRLVTSLYPTLRSQMKRVAVENDLKKTTLVLSVIEMYVTVNK